MMTAMEEAADGRVVAIAGRTTVVLAALVLLDWLRFLTNLHIPAGGFALPYISFWHDGIVYRTLGHDTPLRVWSSLWMYLAAKAILPVLPLAMLFGLIWSSIPQAKASGVPGLGLGFWAVAAVVVLACWLAPLATRTYVSVVSEAFGVRAVEGDVNASSIAELIRGLSAPGSMWPYVLLSEISGAVPLSS